MFANAIRTVTGNYDFNVGGDASEYSTLLFSGSNITGTLPNAIAFTDGLHYTFKQITNATGVVKGYGSQTIDGANTRTLSGQYKYVTVQSDGNNWYIIANN